MMLRFPFHLLLVVVSRFFSAVLRFSFLRSGFVQTTVLIFFSKAVCVNPWNHSNENKSLTHSCKFFFKPCKIFDHSWAISDNPFGCVLPLVHSTLQAASNPRGSRVKNPFLGKSLVYVFLWEVTLVCNGVANKFHKVVLHGETEWYCTWRRPERWL